METCICNKEDIKFAISQMRKSFAGEDEVLLKVIKKTWPIYKNYITVE